MSVRDLALAGKSILIGSTVQLWSMKNYHYYLKQELFSHKTGSKRFRGFKWHPEQPLTIYILGDGECSVFPGLSITDLTTDYVQVRSFVWETYAARLPMPKDTATVAVVDGSECW
jgi:elongator complex protein 1